MSMEAMSRSSFVLAQRRHVDGVLEVALAVDNLCRGGEGLRDFPEEGELVGERLAEVRAESVAVLVADRERVARVAAAKVESRSREVGDERRLLEVLLCEVGVALAARADGEFFRGDVACVVFDLDAVFGLRREGNIDEVPVAGGVRLFGPQEFVTDA